MLKETIIPFFPGFYCSSFEPDTEYEIECINEKRSELGIGPVDFMDIEFDYQDYRNQVGKKVTAFIEKRLKEAGLPCELAFVTIDSPQFYNYSTDRVVATIKCRFADLKKAFANVEARICEDILAENHKSRSGFASFYPYDRRTWLKYMANTLDHNIICTMLQCILVNADDDHDIDDSMYYEGTEDCQVSAKNYDQLTTI